MMNGYCPDCGCKVYGGKCVNCHEESYIYQQNNENEEKIAFSDEFLNKVEEQGYLTFGGGRR